MTLKRCFGNRAAIDKLVLRKLFFSGEMLLLLFSMLMGSGDKHTHILQLVLEMQRSCGNGKPLKFKADFFNALFMKKFYLLVNVHVYSNTVAKSYSAIPLDNNCAFNLCLLI